MMTVKNDVKVSPLHGLGIFATELIPKGTIVWQFNPIIDHTITEAEFQTLPTHVQEFVAHYSYKLDNTYVFCGDNGRYFNHSKSPNTIGLESPDNYGITIASTDIKPGEEITSDYNEFDDDFDRKKTENKFVLFSILLAYYFNICFH